MNGGLDTGYGFAPGGGGGWQQGGGGGEHGGGGGGWEGYGDTLGAWD